MTSIKQMIIESLKGDNLNESKMTVDQVESKAKAFFSPKKMTKDLDDGNIYFSARDWGQWKKNDEGEDILEKDWWNKLKAFAATIKVDGYTVSPNVSEKNWVSVSLYKED